MSSINTSIYHQNTIITMYECCYSLTDLIIPIVILNFIGTATIVLISTCANHWLSSSQTNNISDIYSSSRSSYDNSITNVSQDIDLIADIRAATNPENLSSKVLETRNELSGEQASLETMAGKLISATKNIAGALDNANHIPKDKKEELASLLKGVPGFISKIVDMDDSQLNSLLNGNKLNSKDDFQSRNIFVDKSTLLEDHKKESDFLMKTLDSLRQ